MGLSIRMDAEGLARDLGYMFHVKHRKCDALESGALAGSISAVVAAGDRDALAAVD